MFIDPSELAVKEPRPDWMGRFFHSEKLTLAYYTVEAGATLDAHSHANDEVWNVIEGELEVTIGDETKVMTAGCAAVVPSNAVHALKALTKVRAIVVDHPRRRSIGLSNCEGAGRNQVSNETNRLNTALAGRYRIERELGAVTEEILNALATIPDLRVAGWTSSFSFKGKMQDLRVIGEQLNLRSVRTRPALERT